MDATLDLRRLARVYRALGDRTRLQLVMLLAETKPRHEANVSELANDLGIRQSLASVHLATLRAAGLLTRERRGRRMYYRLDRAALESHSRQVLATLGEEFLTYSLGVLPGARHALESPSREGRLAETGNGRRRRAVGRERSSPRHRYRPVDVAASAAA